MARAGDLELLDHPVAQSLLSSKEPAPLAYTWLDRTPRNVPILFHWEGAPIVFGTKPHAPKIVALRAHPEVPISISEHPVPYKLLYMRGVTWIDVLDDITRSTQLQPNVAWGRSAARPGQISCENSRWRADECHPPGSM
jgi:hypothetical protein